MAKRTVDLKIISNRILTDDYYVLTLDTGVDPGQLRPGQFVQVRVDGSDTTFLRRPISIYDVDREKHTMDLLIKKAGEGTIALSKLKEGDILNLIYPLGNSFTVSGPSKRVLLAGGGVGVAPLYYAARELKKAGNQVFFLLGYRSKNQIIEFDRFGALGEVNITTEDGSFGTRGLLTDHPLLTEGEFDRILSCGPDPMMKAVAGVAKRRGIECEVSLENLMACGFGVCLCCIEETVRGNLCTCTDGPVFNINELKWQI